MENTVYAMYIFNINNMHITICSMKKSLRYLICLNILNQ